MAHRFRPPLWSILGTALLMSLFLGAGVWQARKGLAKRELELSFASGADAPLLQLDGRTPPPDVLAAPRAMASGAYDTEHQILLDNQTRGRVPGYRVWTPLRLADGSRLIVDRGWLASNPHREQLPDLGVSDGAREVRGHWRPLPEPGLRLASGPCAPAPFPRVLNYPTPEELACVLGVPVAQGLLLLDPAEPDGYLREWELPNPVPPARHFAYAAQWFAFAATLMFLFVKLNFKRLP